MTNSRQAEVSMSAIVKKVLISIALALLLIMSSAFSPLPAQALPASSNTEISADFTKASEYIINSEDKTLTAGTYPKKKSNSFNLNKITNNNFFKKNELSHKQISKTNKLNIDPHKTDNSLLRKGVRRRQNFHKYQNNSPSLFHQKETQTRFENFDNSAVKSARVHFTNITLIVSLIVGFVLVGTTAVGIVFKKAEWLFNYMINFKNRNQVIRLINRIYNHKIGGIVIFFSGTCYTIYALFQPYGTQLFQIAETWISNQFMGASMIIALAFFLLRVMLIIYLGTTLVQILQAAKQGEDWRIRARAPLIIVMVITISNISFDLISLITGSGGEFDLIDSDYMVDEYNDW